MADVVQLKSADEGSLADINALIRELSERLPACTSEHLQRIIADPNVELWVVKDGNHIVGMGSLVLVNIPEGVRGQLEDIVVAGSQRGKGLGKEISLRLIERAKERGVRVATLSSRADRVAANALYQKLGFEKHETNSYRLKF
jgi:ribosomal protein S18 acetylase RimI-like enzyme